MVNRHQNIKVGMKKKVQKRLRYFCVLNVWFILKAILVYITFTESVVYFPLNRDHLCQQTTALPLHSLHNTVSILVRQKTRDKRQDVGHSVKDWVATAASRRQKSLFSRQGRGATVGRRSPPLSFCVSVLPPSVSSLCERQRLHTPSPPPFYSSSLPLRVFAWVSAGMSVCEKRVTDWVCACESVCARVSVCRTTRQEEDPRTSFFPAPRVSRRCKGRAVRLQPPPSPSSVVAPAAGAG